MSRAERRAHIGTGYLADANRKTLTLQDDVSKLESNKDFIEMKFRGFVAQMDYMMKNMHEMSDAEIQRRSNTFIQQYSDIRDEIGIEMD